MDKPDIYGTHGLSAICSGFINCPVIWMGKIMNLEDKILIINEISDSIKGCKFLSND